MLDSNYRYRTAARERLPGVLAGLVPKGRHDCGEHEWYKAAEQTWRCYHCEVGVTHNVPWDAREIGARQYEAGAVKIRAGVERVDQHSASPKPAA